MKEFPILCSDPMVRALLNGSKTQTRRILKPQPIGEVQHHFCGLPMNEAGNPLVCKHGQPGDHLWVREAFHSSPHFDCLYRADYADGVRLAKVDAHGGWKPSIHMPRWASRITLEITGVRVERLQDISEVDCWAEGIDAVDGLFDDQIPAIAKRIGCCIEDAKPTYCAMWESINGPGSWEANPWVWVREFKRIAAIAGTKVGSHVL